MTVRVTVSAELAERLADAAEIAHTTVDALVMSMLTAEMDRWDTAFPLPPTPDDLRAALDADPIAASAFESLSRRNRHAIVDLVTSAVRPATRQRRIERAVAMLRAGEAPYRQ